MIEPTPVLIRLMRLVKVSPKTGCWEWQGVVRNSGYGLIGVGSDTDGTRTMASVHRVSYEQHIGKIPDGLFVLHKCDNKICVNPTHLYAGTQKDNISDVLKRGRHFWAKRTHCSNGHKFTPGNTRQRAEGNGRVCLTCQRAASVRHYKKRPKRK